MGEAPRPPYSFGQFRQAQPPSAFFFCQAFAVLIRSAPRSALRAPDCDRPSANSFGAFLSIQARAVLRNSASCGVSSKFIGSLPLPLFLRSQRHFRAHVFLL